ncbi:hypothetical protein BKA62DRAFT_5179 [Auriculariales sp. MPI-PUGE-AT-0066]|nr:hypothetical protein BKA62DRAFT_5179 [Auriculariales sp. MPI-PUGE-AT-0066]
MASQILQAGPAAETVRNVATGHIGDGFGPYAYAQHVQPPSARSRGPQRLSRARVANTSATSERYTSVPAPAGPRRAGTLRMPSTNAVPATVVSSVAPKLPDTKERASTEAQRPELLAERDPEWDAIPDDVFTLFSIRGWINALTLVTIAVGILMLFAIYPVLTRFINPPPDLKSYRGIDLSTVTAQPSPTRGSGNS